MNADRLKQLAIELGLPAPRLVEDLTESPSWVISIPGAQALQLWGKFRQRVTETGFWPVVLQTEGPESDDVGVTLERLKENKRGIFDESEKVRQHFELALTSAEYLQHAESWPFERWVNDRKDLHKTAERYRKKAEFYEGFGTLSDLYRKMANEVLTLPSQHLDIASYAFPDSDELAPAQHDLHATKYYDSTVPGGYAISEEVLLLCLPTVHSWEVPALLYYSTGEYEFSPAVHIAALRWLSESYGADLMALSPRWLELVPTSRPSTPEEALQLAHFLGSYAACTLTSVYQNVSVPVMAKYLMTSTIWSLCCSP